MPRAVKLPDGRILRSREDVNLEAFDQMRPLAERGSALPQGWSVEEAPTRAGAPEYQALQQAPEAGLGMLQRGYQAAAPVASQVRDVATQGLGSVLQGISQMSPEGVSLQDPLMQPGPATQGMGQSIAQNVVPQTPSQAVEAFVLTVLSGMVGPVGGLAGKGVVGGISRTLIPALFGGVTQALVEQEGWKPEDTIATIVGGIAGEGIGPALTKWGKWKWRQSTQDVIGREWADWLGRGVAEQSSVKTLRTPRSFERMLSGEHPDDTLFHQEISQAIGEAQKGIEKALNPSIAAMPVPQRETAMSLLSSAAGIPEDVVAGRALQTVQLPPDTLFKKALQRAREAGERSRRLPPGAEQFAAKQENTALVEQISHALETVNPGLAEQYKGMNTQYFKDIHILDWLWRMKEEGAWKSDTTGVHLNVDKVSNIVSDSAGLLKKLDLMGGPDTAESFMMGRSDIPGARPTSHEGIMRMFMQFLPGAPSISVGGKQSTLVMPTAPVPAAHARALSDYLAADLLKSMGKEVLWKKEEK